MKIKLMQELAVYRKERAPKLAEHKEVARMTDSVKEMTATVSAATPPSSHTPSRGRGHGGHGRQRQGHDKDSRSHGRSLRNPSYLDQVSIASNLDVDTLKRIMEDKLVASKELINQTNHVNQY